ncbi:MAG: hypothetical protein QNJ40_08330 [Xanthomonadales bacterium]|nr:hypothetical protein [Xanthomonadales bacterium]
MANWIGLFLFGYGSWFLYRAWQHRQMVLSIPIDSERKTGKLTNMVIMMPAIINFGLVIGAAQVIIGYMIVGPNAMFGPVDLAGILFVLASYGVWVNVKCRYRPGAGLVS